MTHGAPGLGGHAVAGNQRGGDSRVREKVKIHRKSMGEVLLERHWGHESKYFSLSPGKQPRRQNQSPVRGTAQQPIRRRAGNWERGVGCWSPAEQERAPSRGRGWGCGSWTPDPEETFSLVILSPPCPSAPELPPLSCFPLTPRGGDAPPRPPWTPPLLLAAPSQLFPCSIAFIRGYSSLEAGAQRVHELGTVQDGHENDQVRGSSPEPHVRIA